MKSKKAFKGCLIVVLLILLAIGITLGLLINGYMNGKPTTTYTPEEKQFLEQTHTTEDQQKIIVNLLNECGVEFKSVTHDMDLDYNNLTGYRLKTVDNANVILYLNKDKTVNSIKYAGIFLYKDDSVKSNLFDYIVSDHDKSIIITSCKENVKSILASPSSAEFPLSYDDWYIDKQNGVITVKSYVEAKNAYGTKLKQPFEFTFKDNKIEKFIFNGEEFKQK